MTEDGKVSILSTLKVEADETTSISEIPLKKGLSVGLAAVFIAGEMAGSGVLALPHALKDTGWSGIALLIVCCCNALYAGICLGRCWLILEQRWPEYQDRSRYPYPSIATRAVGPKMRYVVSFCVDFTLFGVATVFLLLSAQIIGGIASKLGVSFCYWILLLAIILWPLMWLGTPHDFWGAALVALTTTCLACILLVIAISGDVENMDHVQYPPPSLKSFFLAFGTILFAFGGASTFPTFQNDMKDRSQFTKAAVIAFVVLFVLYVPVAVTGYKVYGQHTLDNIIRNLDDKDPLTISIEVLLAIHLFFAYLIAINPTAQEMEEFFNVPKQFGWKRCVVRSCIMLVVVFVALSIPRFGKIMELVGGSTVTLMTFVFPPWFYLLLCRESSPEWPGKFVPLYEKVYLIEIMIIGIIGGCISTYSAILEIASPDAFNPPCYVNLTAASIL